MKNWIPVLALGLVITSTAVVARNHVGMGDRHHDMGMLGFMADEIGLTVSQEESINQLVNEARLASAVDRERVSQLRQQLRDLTLDAGVFDEAAVEAVAEELTGIMARMAVDGAQLRWEVRQVLTEEQREHIDSIRKQSRMAHFRFADGEPSEL